MAMLNNMKDKLNKTNNIFSSNHVQGYPVTESLINYFVTLES